MIDLESYDFVDFGCSLGGSMGLAQKHLGGRRGLGIDRSPTKVEKARARGFDVVRGDLAKGAKFRGQVRFAILNHFLEHLPNLEVAKACLDTALAISREFVYVKQPWFDADDRLRLLGLKLYWSDWSGHRNRMTSDQFLTALQHLRNKHHFRRAVLAGRTIISNSDAPEVHPLDSPTDQHAHEPAKHPAKPPRILFGFPVYRELVAVVTKAGVGDQELCRMLRQDIPLHSLSGSHAEASDFGVGG